MHVHSCCFYTGVTVAAVTDKVVSEMNDADSAILTGSVAGILAWALPANALWFPLKSDWQVELEAWVHKKKRRC